MNELLEIHNLFRFSRHRFENEDPQLRRLKKLPCRFESELVQTIGSLPPGVYTLTGGRQVGKSTLAKQVILFALAHRGIPPARIYYLTGEVVTGHTALLNELNGFIDGFSSTSVDRPAFIFIDEVTYIDSWHVAVKFLADAGRLDGCVMVLTGSDTILLKDVVTRLAGRRGGNDCVDFTYYPLSFREYLALHGQVSDAVVEELAVEPLPAMAHEYMPLLYRELETYSMTGGYLTAINDLCLTQRPREATYRTYIDWIRGDFLHRNKNEQRLYEVLRAVVKTSGSQVTWHTLTAELTIQHHQTVHEYCEMLQGMGALFIQEALREDRLCASPKKAKKLHFTDPFIGDAICRSLDLPFLDPAQRIESMVICHIRRRHRVFYIKSSGEIDCAYIEGKDFVPIEIKWTRSIKPEHFRLLRRYRRSVLVARVDRETLVEGTAVVPVPVALLRYG